MGNEGPKKGPQAKDSYEIKGSTPAQRKKDAETFAKLFPGEENPYAKGAEKKKSAAKKALSKLPGGKKEKEYVIKGTTPEKRKKDKKLMDELTNIDIGPNDKLSKVKIAGEGLTAEEIAGKPAKKETKVANKSQKPKGRV